MAGERRGAIPLYDFRCNACGQISEILVRSATGEAASCPACGSEDVERLLSTPTVMRIDAPAPGTTCCGRTERCQTPPCSSNDTCRRA
ncbi:MAG: zinc ribbon domain-containing protein [Chloroflexota bacterium]|nr:zinc ribbon domain-containing protein [Chloroflexota bacterium]